MTDNTIEDQFQTELRFIDKLQEEGERGRKFPHLQQQIGADLFNRDTAGRYVRHLQEVFALSKSECEEIVSHWKKDWYWGY